MVEHRHWEPEAPVQFPPPPNANECTVELVGQCLSGSMLYRIGWCTFYLFLVYVAIEMKIKTEMWRHL